MKSQHISRARKAKAEAAGWAAMGHSEKVARCLRVVQQEVWLARQARKWNRDSAASMGKA
jgi:hypothetical protein